jgi:uncharacterized membrane protein (DUF2068 family)
MAARRGALTKEHDRRQLGAGMQTLDPQDGSAADNVSVRSPTRSHNRGLLLVGLFKLSKAIFFGSLAAGALHLIHRNVGDFVLRVVDSLPVDPESHFVDMLMDRADLINVHQLRQFSFFTFSYSIVCVVEGTGLVLEKVWAEYITIVLTVMGLPWETYELFERFALFKVGVLLVNVAVLLYLLWLLKRKKVQQVASS